LKINHIEKSQNNRKNKNKKKRKEKENIPRGAPRRMFRNSLKIRHQKIILTRHFDSTRRDGRPSRSDFFCGQNPKKPCLQNTYFADPRTPICQKRSQKIVKHSPHQTYFVYKTLKNHVNKIPVLFTPIPRSLENPHNI